MNQERVSRLRAELKQKYPDIPFPERSYLVLMSNRSGSTLLCAHLQKIGFGNPQEGFNPSRRALVEQFGDQVDTTDPYRHITAALKSGSVNNVFGLKMSWVEFEIFLKKARQLIGALEPALSDAEVLEIFFPATRFVRLERRNKIKQAVSYARAMQTGIWRERVNESTEYKEYVRPAEYNRDHIEALLDNILAYDLSWRRFLTENNFSCLEVWYEELDKNYQQTMKAVYDYLGIENTQLPEPQLKKQSDNVSSNWYERFLEETPWLKDARISEYWQADNFEAVFFERSVMLIRKREREVWEKVPYNRMKNLKRIIFRIKKRLGLK